MKWGSGEMEGWSTCVHVLIKFDIWQLPVCNQSNPEGKLIYLFRSFPSKFSLALRSNSFDIKGFLLLLHCCRDAFQPNIFYIYFLEYKKKWIPITFRSQLLSSHIQHSSNYRCVDPNISPPSSLTHNMYLLYEMKTVAGKLFHNSNKKEKRKKMWTK